MTSRAEENKRLLETYDRLLSGGELSIPEDISAWLGHAMLLYGVPFNYLVPDEAVLPVESIRFFYLDPGWLKCLLEGACSVGRRSSIDQVLDQHLRDNFLDLAGEQAVRLRDGKSAGLNWPLSGFLLRSQIVEGWQGLEMKAAGMDGDGNPIDPLPALRMDRLSPDIMLCIFNGKVMEIEIKQPPEGLHFGAAVGTGENSYRKLSLRRLRPEAQAGDQVPGKHAVEVPMREGVRGVIDVQGLATRMKHELVGAGAMGAADPFTSAEFGVQMVESPGMAVFWQCSRASDEQ